MDSRTLFLTANTESVYMTLWLDLSQGPMVLETPPDVLGIIDDAWFKYVAELGRVGPFVGGSHEFIDGEARRIDARTFFHFYATGITPAMAYQFREKGSKYALNFVDAAGDRLGGAKNYTLHLPEGIPAKDFWSIVLYDNQTRSMLQTNTQFPSVGSRDDDLTVNDDGSVDVYFGPEAPAGKEGNWVRTVPGKGFNVILRLYGPTEPWYDKSWKPGEIQRTP